MSEETKLNVIGRASAVALWGLAGKIVSIEACVSAGLPGIDIVGLPDASVSESRKRLRAALAYLGIPVASQHLTINLTPGTVPKIGTGFDLGIAVAVLKAQGIITATDTESIIHCGELGLDGRIRPVTGVLPSLHSGLQAGFERFVVPVGNSQESALLGEAESRPSPHWQSSSISTVEALRSRSCHRSSRLRPSARKPPNVTTLSKSKARPKLDSVSKSPPPVDTIC